MDRRKLIKWLGIGGATISTSGIVSADSEADTELSIKKVAGSSRVLAISWNENVDSDLFYIVYVDDQKEVETRSTHYRLTGLKPGENIAVKIEAYEAKQDGPVISAGKEFKPGRPEMSDMKTQPATPQDVDKDKWKKMSESEKREMFRKGNHRCKSQDKSQT